MQLIPRDAGDEVPLVANGAEVAPSPVKHGEMTSVAIAACGIFVVKGAHGGARVLIDVRALIHAIDILIPEAGHQLRIRDDKCRPYPIRHIRYKTSSIMITIRIYSRSKFQPNLPSLI